MFIEHLWCPSLLGTIENTMGLGILLSLPYWSEDCNFKNLRVALNVFHFLKSSTNIKQNVKESHLDTMFLNQENYQTINEFIVFNY